MVRGACLGVTRILFAIPGDLSAQTGGYAYDRRILSAAPALGAEITHVPLSGRFPDPTEGDVDAAVEAINRARGEGGVVLADGLAWGALPESAIRRIPAPVVALCHHPLCLETGLGPARASALKANERNALSKAAHVVVTSPHSGRTLEREFDIPTDKISVAIPGTDRARKATGTGRPLRLFAIGSIIPRKGFDILVEALSELSELDWSLTIVGSHEHAPETAHDLQRLVDARGLTSRIDLPGELAGDALQRLFDGAGLFVSSSLYEGYGMALAEALAHGLPIVATTGGAAADTIPDGAALRVPPGDPASLRSALRRAIADDGLRHDLADAAWRAGQQLPSWEDAARIIVDAARRVGASAA